jgi:hypothetical protein
MYLANARVMYDRVLLSCCGVGRIGRISGVDDSQLSPVATASLWCAGAITDVDVHQHPVATLKPVVCYPVARQGWHGLPEALLPEVVFDGFPECSGEVVPVADIGKAAVQVGKSGTVCAVSVSVNVNGI